MRYKRKDAFSIGVDEARPFAETYKLDQRSNDLLVVKELGALNLEERSFHLGVVVIGICRTGSATLVWNDQTVNITEGSMFMNFGDSMITDVKMSPDFSATAIVMSHEFLRESVLPLMHLWPYLLFLMESPVVKLERRELLRLTATYNLVVERLQQTDHSFRREATVACLQAVCYDVCDFLKRKVPQGEHLQPRSYALFDQFVRLVAMNYVEHRDVQWYANEMQITPKYLSEVVKEVSGRTSSQWITNVVVTEIKDLLRNSDLSIKEIAVEMNFPNQSFLGKYFKNVVGISPGDFRAGVYKCPATSISDK